MKRNLWDRMAKSYDAKFNSMYKEIFDTLKPKFSKNDQVIEIGCGSGLVSYKIIPLVQRFVGYDISTEMIRVAQNKLSNTTLNKVSFFVGDALNLTTNDKYDIVLVVNLLHVMEKPLDALVRMKSLLKPNGRIFLISYCHGEKMTFKYKVLSILMRIGSKIGILNKVQKFSFGELRELADQANYIIIEEIAVKNQFPFLFLSLK